MANKTDLDKERIVTREMGEEFAEKYGLCYSETSALNGEGVDKVFQECTIKMVDLEIKKELNL